MLNKILSDKISGTKNAFFSLWWAPTHPSFTFKMWFLYELKNKVGLSKNVYGKDNRNNRKATHSFAPRPQIFKLQQEVLKFNNICVSWSSPKSDLETNFLDLEKRSCGNINFSQ